MEKAFFSVFKKIKFSSERDNFFLFVAKVCRNKLIFSDFFNQGKDNF
jgi:hypothetical protein